MGSPTWHACSGPRPKPSASTPKDTCDPWTASRSTSDNLKAAIAGETYEFTTMYPPMLAEAEAEGHRAKLMFGFAMKAEAIHAELYQRALDAEAQGKISPKPASISAPFAATSNLARRPRPAPSAARRSRSSWRRNSCYCEAGQAKACPVCPQTQPCVSHLPKRAVSRIQSQKYREDRSLTVTAQQSRAR